MSTWSPGVRDGDDDGDLESWTADRSFVVWECRSGRWRRPFAFECSNKDDIRQVANVPVGRAIPLSGFYVVGRIVSDKLVKFPFFRNIIAFVWRLAMGMNGLASCRESQEYPVRGELLVSSEIGFGTPELEGTGC
nr:uncharacterized protein LOC109174453 [Ipomoea batatas]